MVNTRGQADLEMGLRRRRFERRKARMLESEPTTPEPEQVSPEEEEEAEDDADIEEEERRKDEDWLEDDEKDVEMNDKASYHTESEDSSEDEDMQDDKETETEADNIDEDLLSAENSDKPSKPASRAPTLEPQDNTHVAGQPEQTVDNDEDDALGFITRLLIKEKQDILIVDENDTYSMTFALAAQRGSFDGIWCSRYDHTEFMPLELPDLLRANRSAARAKHKNCLLCEDPDAPHRGSWYDDMKVKLESLSLSSLARFDLNFCAHQLASYCPPEVPKGLIFLNFPYIKLSGREPGYLQSFLFDCYHVQEEGDVVLVSLTNDPMWYPHYNVPALVSLGERLGYEHSEENTFVRDECQHFGYHHRTYKRWPAEKEEDIHDHVVPDCTIHIFVKGPRPNPPPHRSWITARTHELEVQLPRPQSPWPYTRPAVSSGTLTPSRSTVQHPMTPPPTAYVQRSH